MQYAFNRGTYIIAFAQIFECGKINIEDCIKNLNKTLYFFANGCIVVLGVHLWKSNDKE